MVMSFQKLLKVMRSVIQATQGSFLHTVAEIRLSSEPLPLIRPLIRMPPDHLPLEVSWWVRLGGDPRADAEVSGGVLYLLWPESWSWKMLIGRGTSGEP